MTSRKHYLHPQQDSHMNSRDETVYTKPAQIPDRQGPSTERGSRHSTPPLTKLSVTDAIGKEKTTILSGASLDRLATLQGGPHAWEELNHTEQTQQYFANFVFHFAFFGMFCHDGLLCDFPLLWDFSVFLGFLLFCFVLRET